ncbi:MAG TPA: hypothetical protein VNU22_09110 [Candidatus Acidoferrum sp.]|jgi:hypothetical protein|nr:hypothetical protein [Candidatus Acidoferrum sp.]
MRLSLLGAGAALAASLALSACSGGTSSSSAVPSSGAQLLVMSHGHKLVISPMPGVKVLTGPSCGTEYNFCFYVEKGNDGPYVSTSDDTSPLYNVGYIDKNKNGKLDKKFKDYFYPDPGDPTYQYIDYKGKAPKTAGPVKFTDVYCISFSSTGCAEGSGTILHLGIALSP